MANVQYASDYTLSEFLAVAASKEIKDNETIFAGIGIPLLGATLAKLTHAKNAVIAMESGSIGPQPYRITLGIGDNPCVENATFTTSLWRLFSDHHAPAETPFPETGRLYYVAWLHRWL